MERLHVAGHRTQPAEPHRAGGDQHARRWTVHGLHTRARRYGARDPADPRRFRSVRPKAHRRGHRRGSERMMTISTAQIAGEPARQATQDGDETDPDVLAAQAAAELPAGFVWGAATSAYQIEGALAADGRRPC